jgi:hypothetical protein
MAHLNTRTRLTLKEDHADGDLFPRIDWSVQQDPSLEGASSAEMQE